jgi:hypothetical protein
LFGNVGVVEYYLAPGAEGAPSRASLREMIWEFGVGFMNRNRITGDYSGARVLVQKNIFLLCEKSLVGDAGVVFGHITSQPFLISKYCSKTELSDIIP